MVLLVSQRKYKQWVTDTIPNLSQHYCCVVIKKTELYWNFFSKVKKHITDKWWLSAIYWIRFAFIRMHLADIYIFLSESSFAKILVLTPNKQDISWKVWDAGAFMLDYYSAARRWTAWTCKWYQDRPTSGKSRGLEGEKDHSRVSASYVYSGIMFSSMAQNMEITDRQIPGSYASME